MQGDKEIMKLNLLLISSLLILPTFSNSNFDSPTIISDVEKNSMKIVEKLNDTMTYDTIVNNGIINIDNQDVAYYATFKDNNLALARFKDKFKNELIIISEKRNLSELTNENYKDYYLGIKELSESSLFTYETIYEMLEFFDIYENIDINTEIKTNADLFNLTKSEEYAVQIDALAANYNPVISDLYKERQITPMSLDLPNLNGAISYAKKYAKEPNPLYYKWSADCTNFVSQVLNAGGIGMVTTNSENSGWWYKSSSQRSISWIRADTFSRYMGRVGYKNSSVNWNSFVGKLKAGDFIGYDSSGDGSVDHMAFITDKSGSQVQIAQHTTNYLKWSNSTGWKTNSKNRVLYIVR